jgi:hypothetical protein
MLPAWGWVAGFLALQGLLFFGSAYAASQTDTPRAAHLRKQAHAVDALEANAEKLDRRWCEAYTNARGAAAQVDPDFRTRSMAYRQANEGVRGGLETAWLDPAELALPATLASPGPPEFDTALWQGAAGAQAPTPATEVPAAEPAPAGGYPSDRS